MSLEKYQRVTGALEVKNEETHFLYRFGLFCLLAPCLHVLSKLHNGHDTQPRHPYFIQTKSNEWWLPGAGVMGKELFNGYKVCFAS